MWSKIDVVEKDQWQAPQITSKGGDKK